VIEVSNVVIEVPNVIIEVSNVAIESREKEDNRGITEAAFTLSTSKRS
jgi:hypothetical protein